MDDSLAPDNGSRCAGGPPFIEHRSKSVGRYGKSDDDFAEYDEYMHFMPATPPPYQPMESTEPYRPPQPPAREQIEGCSEEFEEPSESDEECDWCPGSPTGRQGSDLFNAKASRQVRATATVLHTSLGLILVCRR